MAMDKCTRCRGKIKLMCRKGTPFCSTNCAEKRVEINRGREFAIAA